MARNLPWMALLGLLLALAPTALAQEGEEKPSDDARPDDAAWVEDCPPDMMCAAGAEDENATYGDCGAEVCAYGGEDCIECSGPSDSGGAEPGQALGPDDCIDCMRPPADDSAHTCMDGQQEGETCRDDVQYLDGGEPTRGPADGSCENCRGEEAEPISAPAEAAENKVPAPAVALVIVASAMALAVLLVARRQR